MQDFLSDKFSFEVDSLTGEKVVKVVDNESEVLFEEDFSTYIGRDERLAPRPLQQKIQSKTSVFGKLFQQSGFFKKDRNSVQTKAQQERRNNFFRPNFQFIKPKPNPPSLKPTQPNPAVRLAREIYLNFNNLLNAYKSLRLMADKNKDDFKNLENQTLIMRSTIFNIYRALSGISKTLFDDEKFELRDQECVAIEQTQKLVDKLTDDTIKLMRLIEVQKIDRQLLILNATLLSQQKSLEKLWADCVAREV